MTIQTRLIEYTHGDTLLEGFLAWDDRFSEARPAVAIAHAWAGRKDFECNKAKKLAEQGYVAFALDVFGKGVSGESTEECTALITPFLENRELLQDRLKLAIDVVRQQPETDSNNIAAIGFCFGGLCALDMARSGCDVKGVVSFHGLFNSPGNTEGNKIIAKVLCLHGYDDPMAPPQSVLDLAKELSDAEADWQLHAYGNTFHAFTNPDASDRDFGTVYDANADKRSWQAMHNFLEEIFE